MIVRHHRRNLLKRLARLPQVEVDLKEALTQRASKLAARLSALLRDLKYVVYIEKKFKVDELEGDIDVLAWHPELPEVILIVECKALLTPDSSYEIENATKERQRGESQLDKCIGLLKTLPTDHLQRWMPEISWGKVERREGIVCFLQGLGFLHGRAFKYPCCSLTMLERRIPRHLLSTPDIFLKAISTYDWAVPGEIVLKWHEVEIAEWRVRVPMFAYENEGGESIKDRPS